MIPDVFIEYIRLKSTVYTVLSFVNLSFEKGNFSKWNNFIYM